MLELISGWLLLLALVAPSTSTVWHVRRVRSGRLDRRRATVQLAVTAMLPALAQLILLGGALAIEAVAGEPQVPESLARSVLPVSLMAMVLSLIAVVVLTRCTRPHQNSEPLSSARSNGPLRSSASDYNHA